MPLFPNNPHDWALWLFENLEDVQHAGAAAWEGVLPKTWDFQKVVQQLEALPGSLAGLPDESTRKIEFHPASAKVYQSLEEFFSHPANLRGVPDHFTVRDLAYTHGALADKPEQIVNYLATVRLCRLLSSMADHLGNNGVSLHFIKSHDAKIEVKLEYRLQDLATLPSLDSFASNFVESTHHQDQKRNIVRSALLEVFKGSRVIALTDLIPRFEVLADSVRSSYAMYVAEFSFEKVRAEIEKDNLDSTLKLNKTLSDIQNQLLAVPVTLVLVGGQMLPESGYTIKNFVIWIGSLVFGWLMGLLITNQCHAVDAIREEIRLRKTKVDSQPNGIGEKFKKGFADLEKRGRSQVRTLWYLEIGVALSILFSTGLLVWFSYPCIRA